MRKKEVEFRKGRYVIKANVISFSEKMLEKAKKFLKEGVEVVWKDDKLVVNDVSTTIVITLFSRDTIPIFLELLEKVSEEKGLMKTNEKGESFVILKDELFKEVVELCIQEYEKKIEKLEAILKDKKEIAKLCFSDVEDNKLVVNEVYNDDIKDIAKSIEIEVLGVKKVFYVYSDEIGEYLSNAYPLVVECEEDFLKEKINSYKEEIADLKEILKKI